MKEIFKIICLQCGKEFLVKKYRTLCKKCHLKTKWKEEQYQNLFQEIINSKQVYAYTNTK